MIHEFVPLLIEAKCDVDLQTGEYNKGAIHYAAENGNDEVINLFLQVNIFQSQFVFDQNKLCWNAKL